MTEFNASTLILQAPVLGLTTGSSAKEEEVRYYFDREFDLLGRNVRNLFDAIRTGSIAPLESALYVNELLNLSEMGKERLINTLVSRDEEGIRKLEQAAAVFGHVRRPGDLLVQVLRLGAGDRPETLADSVGYSRVRSDRDGMLRRIAPFNFTLSREGITHEHIIYSALKDRYISPGIFRSEPFLPFGSALVLVLEERNTRIKRNIPLDTDGALLFEIPHSGEDFRSILFRDFLDYNEADQGLRRLLGEAQSLSRYLQIRGEENPIYLYDYALSLREDLLRNPDETNKALWKNARNNYLSSLDIFLYGIAQNNIENDQYIVLLNELRIKYRELLDIRTKLETALLNSFCILGNRSVVPRLTSDTEASALLANSLLTARSIVPGVELYLLIGTLAVALLSCLLLCSRKAVLGLVLGLFIIILIILGLSWSFIFTGVWYDPLVPAAAVGMVTLISFIWALVLKSRHKRLFRFCYGPCISASGLKKLIKAARPMPQETVVVRVVVAAVQNTSLRLQEYGDTPEPAAREVLAFREECADVFKKAGGIVAGNGGDLVLGCFGSPPERVITGADTVSSSNAVAGGASVIRAVGLITELLKNEDAEAWCFGLDSGLCAFTWSPLTGYSVFGTPVIRARILSSLTERYHSRLLLTNSVYEAVPNFLAKKVAVLKERDGSRGETFYELIL
jgi:hypothetical protein